MRISNNWLMILAVATILACTAADAMELGPVEGWESGSADIFVFDGEMPDIIGAIDDGGRVDVELPEGIEAGRAFSDSFSCPYEGEISISAPDATFSTLGLSVARVAEQEMIGELKAFSSPEYAKAWRAALGAGDNAPKGGSSYNLIHVSGPVRIEGTCDHDLQIDGTGTAPVKIHTEYAMEFDAGWQLLETETRATVTSERGVTFAVDTRMGAVAPDSDRVDWVVFLER